MTENSYKFYIGVDVSKHKLDVALSHEKPLLEVSNNALGWKELIKQLPNKKQSFDCLGSEWWLREIDGRLLAVKTV